MDKLTRLRLYLNDYRPGQLRSHRIAREWMETDVPADEATEWANGGWVPSEAAPLIAAGVTPQMARELDQIATDVAGSPEERAAQRIDSLVDAGFLVDPQRVRLEQDPDDPDHTIVHIQPT